MRKKYYWLIGGILILFVILFVILLSSNTISAIKINCSIKSFFNEVRNNNYKKAFEKVAYYNMYSDQLSVTDYKTAENIWTNKIDKIKNNGIFLYDYKNIRVWYDDGYPRGTADIFLKEQNIIKLYNVKIYLKQTDGHWKITDIYFPCDHLYEKAISGKIIDYKFQD